ncbi:MAG TPA: hypothetical protein VEL04_03190 [Burkholderiales bacterium]|nr:hypothetical protein [Burkholderiales bacterium]
MKSRISELVAAGSLEISPRELHRAGEVAALLPAGTCVYIPSLPGLPLPRTLETVAALRAAGLDPVPHISARRVLDRGAFRSFLNAATSRYGVHRVLLVGGDEPRAKGPYADSLEVLQDGVLADAGIREIGVAGYPEGHPRAGQRGRRAPLQLRRRGAHRSLDARAHRRLAANRGYRFHGMHVKV